jgi:hypothetical protein
MREYQVRICERLRVKFPGPTRQTHRFDRVRTTIARSTTVNFPLGRIARFGSNSSVWSNAGKPRTSSPSWHLPILRSYSSKSWLVPRLSLQIYCTAKAVGKALPLAVIVLQMLMTTLQERLMLKLSSSCPFVVSLAPRARIGERTVDARRRTGSGISNLASSEDLIS